jgi:hypothetical protein
VLDLVFQEVIVDVVCSAISGSLGRRYKCTYNAPILVSTANEGFRRTSSAIEVEMRRDVPMGARRVRWYRCSMPQQARELCDCQITGHGVLHKSAVVSEESQRSRMNEGTTTALCEPLERTNEVDGRTTYR